ncbi:MAG: hypothetical protein PHN88_16280, partial [Ignavibacteria bacterium]|nr:hypothetical protein [Ignavibacteria bacterium]
MKKRIFTLLAVIGTAVLFYFSVSAFKNAAEKPVKENAVETASSVCDTFTNCIFNSSFREINDEWQLGDQLHVAKSLSRYNELNFNAVQSYDDGIGSLVYGRSDDPQLTGNQIGNYIGFLDSVKNKGGLYGFFERSFISKYCYGQRLRYEVQQYPGNTSENFGFVYQNCMPGVYGTDEGRTVLHANPKANSAGYLCRDIYENIQHSDLFDFRQNDIGTWHIKPVMKIPQNTPGSKLVVRIEIVPFGQPTPVRSIDIKAENFSGPGYNENYVYLTTPLTISGGTNSADLNYGWDDDWENWNANCHVDFRVYWYGECEVWFDKMIVDDEVANYMFDPIHKPEIDFRINQEVTSFTNQGGLYTFFTDEICMSQYPCIKYVVDKMREYKPESRISLAVTNYLHIHGLRNDALPYKIYLDSLKPDFLQDDHHGFMTSTPIPNTFSSNDPLIPETWKASSNYVYNQELQNVIGGKNDAAGDNQTGSLIYEIRKIRNCITQNLPTTKFIMQPQIHGFMRPNSLTGLYDVGVREPTNEEIQVEAMVSIAHGAQGLCWFIYNSHIWKNTNNIPTQYMLGLLDPKDDTTRRTSNCYGENKWQYVSQMNGKIKNWAPTLENITWQEGYSVHQSGAGNGFIEDIKSIHRNYSGEFEDGPSCPECDDVKYWEEGFYLPKDQSSDRSRYVLMVNRRCVPDTPQGTGDVRMLKIKFKLSELSGFNNWKLIDVNTNQSLTFDKNNQGADGFLNLGSAEGSMGRFKPGEGKLFKLAPVMQEGGTFVCDEVVNGLTFDCKAQVYTGTHNLDINGATIYFLDQSQ